MVDLFANLIIYIICYELVLKLFMVIQKRKRIENNIKQLKQTIKKKNKKGQFHARCCSQKVLNYRQGILNGRIDRSF